MVEMESVESQEVFVDYHLLVFLLVVILGAKLLHRLRSAVSSWVVHVITSLPEGLGEQRREIAELKGQIQTISITDDFPKYARLKRSLTNKEKSLSVVESQYQKTIFKHKSLMDGLLLIIIDIVTLVLVLYNRSQPVLLLPEQSIWPLTPILQFPTAIPGAIGSPFWALCIRQTFNIISKLTA